MRTSLAAAFALFFATAGTLAQPRISVVLDPPAGAEGTGMKQDAIRKGRLVVALIAPGAKLSPTITPNEGPFWDDEQPIFAKDVEFLLQLGGSEVKSTIAVDETFEFNALKLADLPPGKYRAQARFITTRTNSSMKRDAGNWSGPVTTFEITEADRSPVVTLSLKEATRGKVWEPGPGVELFEVESKLLSEFHHRPVKLRAGVALPLEYKADGTKRYSAVYEIPGFGGDHTMARPIGAGRSSAAPRQPGVPPTAARELAEATFWIVLDPESPNGHTLFADSANNGPCGRALVEELIPALEAKYPLLAKPEARLLRGHSSGGWSSLWLGLNYPQTFGATWSSSPDPVDFRRFQTTDIYSQPNAYFLSAADLLTTDGRRISATPGALFDVGARPGLPEGSRYITSYRRSGKPVMSAKQEMRGEDMLGADNTSGQQWDSWFAVWGPRSASGHPAALVDPLTGAINQQVAEQYAKYDINRLLRADAARFGPILRQRVCIVVGDADEFFLNEAVATLRQTLDEVAPATAQQRTARPGELGTITILPGKTHGLTNTPEVKAFPAEMLAFLKDHGALPATSEGR